MIRVNVHKILTDKILTDFAVKILKLPKRKYKDIVLDFFDTPVALLYDNKGVKLQFLNPEQQELVDRFVNMSTRQRKDFIKQYLKGDNEYKKAKLKKKNLSTQKIRKAFEKFSSIDLRTLINGTKHTMFSKPIQERVKNIGHFEYLGFEYTFDRNKKNNLILFINMYFYVTSAPHKTKSGGKKRVKYLIGIKFPYLDGMNNFKRIVNVPIKIFSSDPSFNYYLAYALNSANAALIDHPKLLNHIQYAITHYPKIRNPDLKKELTKHLYKVVEFLLKYSPLQYLHEQYLTNIDKIKIPQKPYKPKWM